ncbi:MAG TPA: HPr kinase/phosphatase C-terminal domain-containing protein [Rhizomicrobium sp.]|jgi:hypothetical protein|nr:HPr kinase/phosphatase C-terminal domain-containing protein [Rhizomicrobium sp.]
MNAPTIHASCIILANAGAPFGAAPDAGVLLLGESGSGKSDLVLRLIGRGAILVADDRTELYADDDKLMARCPAALAGLIEVRGLGIVALPHAAQAHIVLVADLGPHDAISRLPDRESFEPPGLSLPLANRPPHLRLNGLEASAPDKIVLAAAAFTNNLLRHGHI